MSTFGAHWWALFAGLHIVGLLIASRQVEGTTPGRPTGLTAVDLEPSSAHGVAVTLTWRDPAGSNTSLRYYVRYAPEGGRTTQKMVSDNRATLKLSPNMWYMIKVMALTADHRMGPWSPTIRIFTNESVPSMSPLNVTATSEDTSSIRVSWGPIPPQYHHALLQGYIVFYRESASRRWQRKSVPATMLEVRISGLLPGTQYRVAVAGFTNKGAGKKSMEATVTVQGNAITERATTLPSTTASSEGSTTEALTSESLPSQASVHVTSITASSTSMQKTPVITHSTFHTQPVTVHVITESTSSTGETSPRAPVTTNSPHYSIPDVAAVQALKKEKTKHKSSMLDFALKVILPAAGGGLILVLLIVCLLWRRRRAREHYKRQRGDEAIGLEALSDNKRKAKETKCVVTRGEGSIRYAPPSCPAQCSSRGPGGAASTEEGVKLHESSQGETTETSGVDETSPMLVLVGCTDSLPRCSRPLEDERYVKRADPSSNPAGDPGRIYAVPFAPPRSPKNPIRFPRNAGYENMQHLYEALDGKDSDDGKHLYQNVSLKDGEGLYAEIPANDTGQPDTMQQQGTNMDTNLLPL